jgi:hypothetical protein
MKSSLPFTMSTGTPTRGAKFIGSTSGGASPADSPPDWLVRDRLRLRVVARPPPRRGTASGSRRFQIREQFARRWVSLSPVALDRAPDDAGDRGRKVGRRLPDRRGLRMEDRVHEGDVVVALERQAAGSISSGRSCRWPVRVHRMSGVACACGHLLAAPAP